MSYSVFSRERRVSRVSTWLIVLLVGLVGVLVYRQLVNRSPLFNPYATPRAITPRGDLSSDEKTTIELFHEVASSVVHITAVALQQNVVTMDVLAIPAGSGSGFIWDQQGHIVTNLHVIRDSSGATVTLADNSNWNARLVGFDAANDLAVLKIDAPPNVLKPLAIGTSHDLQVGQRVFAIGSPFEFDHTLTTGIISGLNRSIETPSGRLSGAVQTDAAINPGNSGGPLLDSAARLIGVNTAIATQSGGSHGIGFAVPVDVVNASVPDLIRDGRITRPWLGIFFREKAGTILASLPGVVVEQVVPGSPAHRAGIIPMQRLPNGSVAVGDLIIAVDQQRIDTGRDLLDALSRYSAGDTIVLKVIRGEQTIEIPVLLELMPEEIPGEGAQPEQAPDR
jgi:S1-C subfamily serine protease